MNSEAITRLQLGDGDKSKNKKVVQLDKPKPVTQVAPVQEKKHEPKEEIFVRQEPATSTNLQDLLSAKLQELALQEPPQA